MHHNKKHKLDSQIRPRVPVNFHVTAVPATGADLTEQTLTVEIVKSVGSCDLLDKILETYIKCIRQACDVAIPPRNSKHRLKLPWLSPESEGLKSDMRTKKRRIRNAAPTRRDHVDILLQTNSGRVLGPDESATLLAEIFFSDDRADTKDPHYTAVRTRTDRDDQPPVTSGDLPRVDPPFTGAEVKNVLKLFHSRKALSIDGLISNTYQAKIFRDLELFLAMANKCLELGYFSRARKMTAYEGNPKAGQGRSSLEILTISKTHQTLAHLAKRDIFEIVAKGRAVCLFWVKAHAGIVGNERADDLARRTTLTKKTAVDYDKFVDIS
ncbi:hypothetical protein EVAR_51292_1 [Eumeta japonica]|uniref:RNase H type-1 domain-containing protein n=1 Tax=Eumeta variegata TaxID=151549 RepID=A0A4C1XSU8_EUMVA|nr:hypothetical protein EVAR_51292_1 [Eumeta japonica]